MTFFGKILLNIILLVNVVLPCSAIFINSFNCNLTAQENSWVEAKKFSVDDASLVFKQTKENFEKKIAVLNILWEQRIYQEVMIAINHLYERWLWLRAQFPISEMFKNLDNLPLDFQKIAELEWMANQIVYWDTKLKSSPDNNDELLNNFFNFQSKANTLDSTIDYQITNLKSINWKDEAKIYHFLDHNLDNLKSITEEYNLLNRQLLEWEGSSNYNSHVYSLAQYRKFKKIYDLITIKIKNNFHYFIKLIIKSINQENKKLINKITYIKKQKNLLSHEYFLLLNKWKLIKQYKDYLIHEELQENLINQFAEFNRLASQIELLFQETYPNLLQDFVTNLTILKQNLIKKQEKITFYGIWEKIVDLHKIFKDYKNDFQLIKENTNKYSFHFKPLFIFLIDKLIEDIEQIFKTIHYQGINSVQDDPTNENLLIKSMTDEAFLKMANNYVSEKNLISIITKTLGSVVIVSTFSYIGAAGGFLGVILGAIAGAVLSYAFSEIINHLVDIIYGEWNQLLNNFSNISKGAGVIFKIPKNHKIPQDIIAVIKNTIKPQEPKFLV